MKFTAGLFALALLSGADAPPKPAPAPALVSYQLKVLEMSGLDWRGAAHARLSPVTRQGRATVWTAARDLVPTLTRAAHSVESAPKVTQDLGAPPATIRIEDRRNFVADLQRVADGPVGQASRLAFKPEIDQVRNAFVAVLATREQMDQGLLTRVTIDDERMTELHTYRFHEKLKPAKDGKSFEVAPPVQVPEIVQAHAAGEWLIPNDGILVISLGAYTSSDAKGKAVVHERLVLIEAEPTPADPAIGRAAFETPIPLPPAPIGPSNLSTVANSTVGAIVPPPQSIIGAIAGPRPMPLLPPMPIAAASAPIPPPPPIPGSPAAIAPITPFGVPATGSSGPQPVMVVLQVPMPVVDAFLRRISTMTPSPAGAPMIATRPMPTLPSRRLPIARDADGSIVPLPPLPEEPATEPDASDEPRPAPQSRHVPPPTADRREAPRPRIIASAPGEPFPNRTLADLCASADGITSAPEPPDVHSSTTVRGCGLDEETANATDGDCCPADHANPKAGSKTRTTGDQRTDSACCEDESAPIAAQWMTELIRSALKNLDDAAGEGPRRVVDLEFAGGKGRLTVDVTATRREGSPTHRAQYKVMARATAGPSPQGTPGDKAPESAAACPSKASNPEAEEVWNLTLRDAIRIGLDNSENIRMVKAGVGDLGGFEAPEGNCGSYAVIAPVDADTPACAFKAETMALVRSIEQQYWALGMAQAQYWVSEQAVDLGKDVLKAEKAKCTAEKNNQANIIEAQEQLERFKLDYIDKTANLITTERQLRNLLGLPVVDNRRIVPVTAPTEAELVFDFDACRATMCDSQPDVIGARCQVAAARAALISACKTFLHTAGADGPDDSMAHLSAIESACRLLARQEAFARQVEKQTTQSLQRFTLETASNYKLLQTARRLKLAALQRLQAQRTFYEKGTITIDRYLDAINRWATAVSQEAQFRSQYNTALAAVAEARGSLLEDRSIALAEPPRQVEPIASKTRDARAAQTAHQPDRESPTVAPDGNDWEGFWHLDSPMTPFRTHSGLEP